MAEVRVDEPLGWVTARFEKGAISPIAFRWKAREFRVASVNARWIDRATRPIRHGFSVSAASGEVIELEYREGDPVWYVTAVSTP
ncbi:MAG TPA: hypothetical protein VK661_12155 [Planctomycetota bacterium]|jgi:hypothetical protein|nr:hypothetical protein [Planctomycetota bacterium]